MVQYLVTVAMGWLPNEDASGVTMCISDGSQDMAGQSDQTLVKGPFASPPASSSPRCKNSQEQIHIPRGSKISGSSNNDMKDQHQPSQSRPMYKPKPHTNASDDAEELFDWWNKQDGAQKQGGTVEEWTKHYTERSGRGCNRNSKEGQVACSGLDGSVQYPGGFIFYAHTIFPSTLKYTTMTPKQDNEFKWMEQENEWFRAVAADFVRWKAMRNESNVNTHFFIKHTVTAWYEAFPEWHMRTYCQHSTTTDQAAQVLLGPEMLRMHKKQLARYKLQVSTDRATEWRDVMTGGPDCWDMTPTDALAEFIELGFPTVGNADRMTHLIHVTVTVSKTIADYLPDRAFLSLACCLAPIAKKSTLTIVFRDLPLDIEEIMSTLAKHTGADFYMLATWQDGPGQAHFYDVFSEKTQSFAMRRRNNIQNFQKSHLDHTMASLGMRMAVEMRLAGSTVCGVPDGSYQPWLPRWFENWQGLNKKVVQIGGEYSCHPPGSSGNGWQGWDGLWHPDTWSHQHIKGFAKHIWEGQHRQITDDRGFQLHRTQGTIEDRGVQEAQDPGSKLKYGPEAEICTHLPGVSNKDDVFQLFDHKHYTDIKELIKGSKVMMELLVSARDYAREGPIQDTSTHFPVEVPVAQAGLAVSVGPWLPQQYFQSVEVDEDSRPWGVKWLVLILICAYETGVQLGFSKLPPNSMEAVAMPLAECNIVIREVIWLTKHIGGSTRTLQSMYEAASQLDIPDVQGVNVTTDNDGGTNEEGGKDFDSVYQRILHEDEAARAADTETHVGSGNEKQKVSLQSSMRPMKAMTKNARAAKASSNSHRVSFWRVEVVLTPQTRKQKPSESVAQVEDDLFSGTEDGEATSTASESNWLMSKLDRFDDCLWLADIIASIKASRLTGNVTPGQTPEDQDQQSSGASGSGGQTMNQDDLGGNLSQSDHCRKLVHFKVQTLCQEHCVNVLHLMIESYVCLAMDMSEEVAVRCVPQTFAMLAVHAGRSRYRDELMSVAKQHDKDNGPDAEHVLQLIPTILDPILDMLRQTSNTSIILNTVGHISKNEVASHIADLHVWLAFGCFHNCITTAAVTRTAAMLACIFKVSWRKHAPSALPVVCPVLLGDVYPPIAFAFIQNVAGKFGVFGCLSLVETPSNPHIPPCGTTKVKPWLNADLPLGFYNMVYMSVAIQVCLRQLTLSFNKLTSGRAGTINKLAYVTLPAVPSTFNKLHVEDLNPLSRQQARCKYPSKHNDSFAQREKTCTFSVPGYKQPATEHMFMEVEQQGSFCSVGVASMEDDVTDLACNPDQTRDFSQGGFKFLILQKHAAPSASPMPPPPVPTGPTVSAGTPIPVSTAVPVAAATAINLEPATVGRPKRGRIAKIQEQVMVKIEKQYLLSRIVFCQSQEIAIPEDQDDDDEAVDNAAVKIIGAAAVSNLFELLVSDSGLQQAIHEKTANTATPHWQWTLKRPKGQRQVSSGRGKRSNLSHYFKRSPGRLASVNPPPPPPATGLDGGAGLGSAHTTTVALKNLRASTRAKKTNNNKPMSAFFPPNPTPPIS
ncbi:hypothetical protein BDV93DRAFT_513749 [Ceratobasidium sp. AG-I]|nr:hypothetical protein BDV93DRAFT_513749 [Ceratobasidium sp. AG-I]